MSTAAPATAQGLLGDTPLRDYTAKLRSFNAFAAPELRRLIESLELKPGMRVFDAGCGSGEALVWLHGAVQPGGQVQAIDLSAAHVAAARTHAVPGIEIFTGDLLDMPLQPCCMDLVWCINTINHLRNPLAGVERLQRLLRRGARLALGQSSLLADMIFAWDARLERVTHEAVRRYYLERYGIDEQQLASVRALVGLLRQAGLQDISAKTIMIERIAPLDAAALTYIGEAIFRDTWGERLRPYLSTADYLALGQVCDPDHPSFALRRPDFHFLQSFTLVSGVAP